MTKPGTTRNKIRDIRKSQVEAKGEHDMEKEKEQTWETIRQTNLKSAAIPQEAEEDKEEQD